MTVRSPFSFEQRSEEGEGVWIIILYNLSGLALWLMPKILALGSWRQEDCHEFSLGYRTDKTKEFSPCSQSCSWIASSDIFLPVWHLHYPKEIQGSRAEHQMSVWLRLVPPSGSVWDLISSHLSTYSNTFAGWEPHTACAYILLNGSQKTHFLRCWALPVLWEVKTCNWWVGLQGSWPGSSRLRVQGAGLV